MVDSNETLDYIEHGLFGEAQFQQEKIGKKGEGRIVRERKSYRKIGVIKTRSKLFREERLWNIALRCNEKRDILLVELKETERRSLEIRIIFPTFFSFNLTLSLSRNKHRCTLDSNTKNLFADFPYFLAPRRYSKLLLRIGNAFNLHASFTRTTIKRPNE